MSKFVVIHHAPSTREVPGYSMIEAHEAQAIPGM